MKKFLEKIRNLPEDQRKIILWAVVIVLGAGLYILYFKSMIVIPIDSEKLQKDLKIDELKEDLKNLPSFETPDMETEVATSATTTATTTDTATNTTTNQ